MLTLNTDPSKACAGNVDDPPRNNVLLRVAFMQPQFPATEWWVELDDTWEFLVYVTLDLAADTYNASEGDELINIAGVDVPRKYVFRADNPQEEENTVQYQGSGRLPGPGNQLFKVSSPENGSTVYTVDTITGGRVGRTINGGLEFKAAAAPVSVFPNQAALFAPILSNLNSNGGLSRWGNYQGILSIEDTGATSRRVDIYAGVDTRLGAIGKAGGYLKRSGLWSLWAVVEINPPLVNECSVPSTIGNVRIKEGAGMNWVK